MKKTFLYLIPASLILIFSVLVSCNDPVFYTISLEDPPEKPLIGGSPSRLLEFNNAVYVASGRNLFWYAEYEYEIEVKDENGDPVVDENGDQIKELRKEWRWAQKSFDSWIKDIAVTEKYIYVCMDKELQRSDDGSNWDSIYTDLNMQKIYGAGGNLYISSCENLKISSGNLIFTIDYIPDSSNEISPVNINTVNNNVPKCDGNCVCTPITCGGVVCSCSCCPPPTMLIGTAVSGDQIFLCSREGILIATDAANFNFLGGVNRYITGIIHPENNTGTIFTIDYYGNLYTVTSAGINSEPIASFGSRRSTGALAVYETYGKYLLLAGRMDVGYAYNSGYTYGYVEILLNDDKTSVVSDANNFKDPGTGDITTVANYERYISSLGRNPVNFIHQAPNGRLFASTQKNGVWSYRNRGTEESPDYYWNAEN